MGCPCEDDGSHQVGMKRSLSWPRQEQIDGISVQLQKRTVGRMLQPRGCLRLCLKIGLPTVEWNSAVFRPDSEK